MRATEENETPEQMRLRACEASVAAAGKMLAEAQDAAAKARSAFEGSQVAHALAHTKYDASPTDDNAALAHRAAMDLGRAERAHLTSAARAIELTGVVETARSAHTAAEREVAGNAHARSASPAALHTAIDGHARRFLTAALALREEARAMDEAFVASVKASSLAREHGVEAKAVDVMHLPAPMLEEAVEKHGAELWEWDLAMLRNCIHDAKGIGAKPGALADAVLSIIARGHRGGVGIVEASKAKLAKIRAATTHYDVLEMERAEEAARDAERMANYKPPTPPPQKRKHPYEGGEQ